MSEFRKKYNIEERKKLSQNILSKYEDKIPIYLSFDKDILSCVNPLLKKNINRYIVSSSLTFLQFISIVKKKINIKSDESLTLFIEHYNKDKITDTVLCPISSSIQSIYLSYKDEDDFLYLKLIKENVFG